MRRALLCAARSSSPLLNGTAAVRSSSIVGPRLVPSSGVRLLFPARLAGVRPLASNAAPDSSKPNRSRLFGELKRIRSRKRLAEIVEQLQPLGDVKSYTQVITAHIRVGSGKRAVAMLDEMREAGVEPNVITYNAAISAFTKVGQWENALSLFKAMAKAGVEANAITRNAVVSAVGGLCDRADRRARTAAVEKGSQEEGENKHR